jgi:threonine-phosphate decarboxylase
MNESHRSQPPLHGGQLRQLAAQYGVPPESFLDFSANINPAGPPPSVLSALRKALERPETLTTYPDLELTDLKKAIADLTKVHSKSIVIANGFAPLLEAALGSLKIKRCLLPVPAFSEYRRTLERGGVAVRPYQLSPAAGFSYDPDTILQSLESNACDAILLANPQNPSGTLCQLGQMLRLVEITAKHNITLLLDEAFIDYSPTHSLVQHAAEQPHMIVFRSVTKFFAIPGLRVAYAVCDSAKAETLNRSIVPWPITTLASHAVCAALVDEGYAEESRAANERRRSWLEQQLNQLRVETYRPGANFLLLRFPADVNVHLLWEKMIIEQQIVLRSCTNFEGLEAGHLRLAVKSEQENERFIAGLRRALG